MKFKSRRREIGKKCPGLIAQLLLTTKVINHTIGCGQTFRVFMPGAACYTRAAGGDEGFPIEVHKAFPLGTWGRILAIVLVHHKSLSVS